MTKKIKYSPLDLELSPEKMREMGETALTAVIDHIRNLPTSPRSNLENGDIIARGLKEPPPENGMEFSRLLEFLMREVIPVSVNTAHPSFMGFIPDGGLYPSAVAELLAAATNRYVGVWFESPAAVRLEANVLDWFSRWMGYPEAARGILTSGGSLANFSAVVTARRHILGDDITRGTIYVSDQAHHCILKAAMLAGIPERNVRILESDDRFHAVPRRFETAIQKDREQGFIPFLCVASAGTTNTGAVDPLEELADIAENASLWYHVDGAYGGFFNLCPEGARILRGIDRSDSVVLDPHKGLFLPYGTGSLLVKDGERLRRAHCVTAEYLQDLETPPGEMNPTEYSPELTRSYRGLRVWLPLKLYGTEAFRENLAEKLELTRMMDRWFRETPGFECLSEPELSVITFRYRPKRGDIESFNRNLLAEIVRSRKLFLSSTLLKGRYAIRICILSFRTHLAEIEEAFDIINSAACELESSL